MKKLNYDQIRFGDVISWRSRGGVVLTGAARVATGWGEWRMTMVDKNGNFVGDGMVGKNTKLVSKFSDVVDRMVDI